MRSRPPLPTALAPYRRVLATPGAPGFVTAGLLARLPLSMNGIGLLLLVQDVTGSYGSASAVVAAYTVAQAVAGPALSRLVDSLGQARVIGVATAVHAASTTAVLLAAAAAAHAVMLGALAALVGASFASYGSLVRARWAWVLREPAAADGLHAAFSLESVLDEVVFTVGPPLVTVLAVGVSPTVALLAGLVAQLAGATALALQRRTQPVPAGAARTLGSDPPTPSATRSARAAGGVLGVLRVPGLLALVATFVGTGVVFGSVEIVAVAFTDERGVPAAAGLVLALYSVGSLLAGLAFGAVSWQGSLPRRFRLSAVAMAVLIAPVAAATSVPLLAAGLFLSGLAISPTLICGNALVAELVEPRQLTEGLAWVGTAVGIGISLGAALAGPLVEDVGAQRTLLVPVVGAVASALVVVACSRPLGVVRRAP